MSKQLTSDASKLVILYSLIIVKNNFQNLIFDIDKMFFFDIMDSTVVIIFLCPKGVVDG